MSIEIRQNVIDVTVNVRQDGLAISLQPVIVRNGGNGGGGSVNSVFGRTGSVTAQTGDYTTEQITESVNKNYLTDTERSKLASITAIFTTALKTAYDGVVTWISTNGANVLNSVTKTDFITVTQAVDLDQIETDVTSNNSKVGITPAQAANITSNTAKISFDSTSSTRLANTSGTNTGDQDISGKQNTLVSGTNIKTINGNSLLGSTDLVTGDVTGPASSIDNTIPRFDSTTGKVIDSSLVKITDLGAIDLPLNAAPVVSDTDRVNLFGRKIGGRMLPAFMSPSGLDSAIQPLIARNKIAWANPLGNSATVSLMGIALSATGTATVANVTVTNVHTVQRRLEYVVSVVSTSAVAGWRDSTPKYFLGSGSGFGGFTFVNRFGPSRGVAADATRRFFVGFTSSTGAPTDVDPSTIANCLGVGADSADTNWQFMHRTGTGAVVKVDTGISKLVADATEAYEVAMFTAPNSGIVSMEFTRMSDNTIATYTAVSSIPVNTTLLAPRGNASVGGTSSAIGISLISLYIETDY